jgi:L-ascorbate metabolism protein UlaG (beta-lactamase superfamily)
MTLQNYRPSSRATDWDDVEIGDAVQLSRGGRLEHAGRVDNRTADGAVVWVVSTGGHRKLFHVADGFELTVADPEGVHHAEN